MDAAGQDRICFYKGDVSVIILYGFPIGYERLFHQDATGLNSDVGRLVMGWR